MSRKRMDREQLQRSLNEQLARHHSASVLMYHQTVADNLGLNATDLKCLELVLGEEDVTAGRMAEASGLTTAAITSVIDRLERSGFVRRERDQEDRRKVIIRPLSAHLSELDALFLPLSKAMDGLYQKLSEEELVTIQNFIIQTDQVLQLETIRLRELRNERENPGF